MRTGLLVNLGIAALVAAFAVLASLHAFGAVLAGAALTAVFVLRRRAIKLGFFVLVVLVPLDTIGQLNMTAAVPVTVTKLLFPPVFAAFLVDRVLSRRPLRAGPLTLCVAAFGAAILCSLAFTGLQAYTLTGLRRYLGVLLLFVLATNIIETERDLRTLLIVIVASCTVSSTLGILESRMGLGWVGIRSWGTAGQRLSGVSGENPNTFATNLLVAFFVSLTFALCTRRLALRTALLLLAGLLLAGITFSASRGVTLAMLVTCGYALYRLRRRVPGRWFVLWLGVVVLGVLPFVPGLLFERFAALLQGADADFTLQRRFAYHAIGLDLFARHPLWGVGPNAFPLHYMASEYRFLTDQSTGPRMLHNLYLLIACEFGIVGLTCFGLVVRQAFRHLSVIPRTPARVPTAFLQTAAEALRIALVAFLLGSVFLPTEHQKYLWILFAASGAAAAVWRARPPDGGGAAPGTSSLGAADGP